jgi:hypothetical protein
MAMTQARALSLQNSLTNTATIWRPEKLNSWFCAFLKEELEMAGMTKSE